MRHTSSHKIVCWQVTRFCNRECVFCTSKSGPKVAHSERNITACLNRMIELGVEKISISGGEPLSYPYLREVVEQIDNKGLKQILTTNGDFIRPGKFKFLRGLEYVKVSFYGDKMVHDSVMGMGHFEKLVSAIRMLRSEGVLVTANFLLTQKSRDTLNHFYKMAASEGLAGVLLLTYMNSGTDVQPEMANPLPRKSIEETITISRRWLSNFQLGIKIHDYAKSGFYIVIDDRDRVTIPSNDTALPFIVGDLSDEFGHLPDGEYVPMRLVFEHIWSIRKSTDSIIPII